MTPPTRFRFLTREHSTESPEKSYVLAGASHKPYGMNEPFSVQPTDRKLATGRRGHDPALRNIPANTNLLVNRAKPISTSLFLATSAEISMFFSHPSRLCPAAFPPLHTQNSGPFFRSAVIFWIAFFLSSRSPGSFSRGWDGGASGWPCFRSGGSAPG